MRKHDDAAFHYKGQFPNDLPDAAGGTHIGLFVTWLLLHGKFAPSVYERAAPHLDALRERRITGREFLFRVLDEELLPEDLTEEADQFATDYYDEVYLDDYIEILVPDEMDSIYRVDDNWENYDKLAPRIDERFASWSKTGTLPPAK